jgi:hypothetical protein
MIEVSFLPQDMIGSRVKSFPCSDQNRSLIGRAQKIAMRANDRALKGKA